MVISNQATYYTAHFILCWLAVIVARILIRKVKLMYDEDDVEMSAALEGLAGKSPYRTGNAIMTIVPYADYGTWVFDDPAKGLVKEPFVLGIPEMINVMVADIPNARGGFRLNFMASKPPRTSDVFHLKKVHEEDGGAWYRDTRTRLVGWLCPATLNYFPAFPDEIWCWSEEMHTNDQYQTRVNTRREIQRLGLNPNLTPSDYEMLLSGFSQQDWEKMCLGQFEDYRETPDDLLLPTAEMSEAHVPEESGEEE